MEGILYILVKHLAVLLKMEAPGFIKSNLGNYHNYPNILST